MGKALSNRGRGVQVDGAYDGTAVTPADGSDLPDGLTRGLWVGTGGDVVVDFAGGTTAIVLKNVADGTLLPVQVIRVRTTNTTASNIVALY